MKYLIGLFLISILSFGCKTTQFDKSKVSRREAKKLMKNAPYQFNNYQTTIINVSY